MSNHAGYQSHQMDGDASNKTLEKGASSALNTTEFTDGIHEAAKPPTEPVGEKATGSGTSAFSSEGSIGSQFTHEGAIGGTAQQIGGVFDKDGAIGKHFTEGGAVGGSVQQELGNGKESSSLGGKS